MSPPPRWPAAALAGLALGVALGPLSDVRVLALLLVALAAFSVALRDRAGALGLLFALFVALGVLRTDLELRLLARDPLAGMDRSPVEVRGTVLESPRPRSWGSAFRFRVEGMEDRADLPAVEVLVEVAEDLRLSAGEAWRFRGRLDSLPGARHPRGFDAGAWLARQGIHHRVRAREAEFLGGPAGWGPQALAWRLRTWLSDNLEGRLDESARALVLGIALGESRSLAPEIQESFRRSGTSHLLAASGLNVAIVTGLVFWLARRLGYGPRPAALPALLAAGFYALLAGGSPSVVRAAVMAGVALVALALGRRTDPLHSLLLAGLLVLAWRPLWLHDAGFQLSCAAVAGLLAWYDPLERRLAAWPRPVRTSVAASLAAGVAVAPLLAWHFQQVSVVSVLANLVMTPVAEALLPVGLLASVLAGLVPLLAGLPLFLCSLASEGLVGTAALLGNLVDPVRVPRPGPAALLACLLGMIWLRLVLAREGPARGRPLVAVLALLLAAWSAAPARGTGSLVVRLADLPQGTVAWVETPGGLDLVLLESEASRDAAGELLGLYGRPSDPEAWFPGGGAPRTEAPEPGVRVEVLPGALRLTWGDFSLLWATAEASPERLPPGTVALLPRRWEPANVLRRVRPRLTIWPGGRPREAWRERGDSWWSTGEQGPLEIRTDGREVLWHRWEG